MKTEKYIISVVGPTCAGKETFGEMIRKEFGPAFRFLSRRFSDPLNEMLHAIRVPQNRPNQQLLSKLVRQEWGEDVLGNALSLWMEEVDANIIYIDGVRRPADVEMIRKFPSSFLVSLNASPEVRFERLKKRADRPGDAEKTWEEFLAEQNAESEQKIVEIAKTADVFIDNSGMPDNLRVQVRKFIEEYIKLV